MSQKLTHFSAKILTQKLHSHNPYACVQTTTELRVFEVYYSFPLQIYSYVCGCLLILKHKFHN